MKRLTILLGDDNNRLVDLMDEIGKVPYDGINKPHMVEFPERDAFMDPRPQHDRKHVAYNWVDQSKKGPIVICTQDEVIFTAIRVAIHQQRITTDEVEFRWHSGKHEPLILQVDQYGRVNNWPAGFFDTMEHLLSILLGPKPGTLTPPSQ